MPGVRAMKVGMETRRSGCLMKKAVRAYWEAASCGTNHTDKPKYSRRYFDEIETYRYTKEPWVYQFAQFSRAHGKKVLEVGVGAGTDFMQWLRSGSIATGIDLTNEAVCNCRQRMALEGFQAEVRQADAENLPFEDNTYDLVYSMGVIHHSPNTLKALSEVYRVTKPGGIVKIMVYNRYAIYTLTKWLKYGLLRGKSIDWVMAHYQESPGTKVYSIGQIRKIMKEYPHKNLKFYLFDSAVFKSHILNALLWTFGFYLAWEFEKYEA
jgi:ubiquinone/menaquinone biosynthesis C-methylase UbiE